ncbi:MAG: sialidase family protein [Promethearchaeota archaeon]
MKLSTRSVVFKKGEENIDTYRIPAILCLPDDELLAFAEARVNSSSDFGYIRMVMRRSTDGGETWSPIQTIWDYEGLAVQDPCPIYDENKNMLYLLLILDRKYPHMILSRDKGKTWEKPRPLESVTPSYWGMNGPCPGHGIQLPSGRLVAACFHSPPNEELMNEQSGEQYDSHVIFSDDDGENWKIGHVFDASTNECLVECLGDDNLIMILRENHSRKMKKKPFRRILKAWSNDGGITFSKPEVDDALPSPICQASIVVDRRNGKKSSPDVPARVYLTNPATKKRRKKLTIRLSEDNGKTWKTSLLINKGPSGYSDLCVFSNGDVGCLFENGKKGSTEIISFSRIIVE